MSNDLDCPVIQDARKLKQKPKILTVLCESCGARCECAGNVQTVKNARTFEKKQR